MKSVKQFLKWTGIILISLIVIGMVGSLLEDEKQVNNDDNEAKAELTMKVDQMKQDSINQAEIDKNLKIKEAEKVTLEAKVSQLKKNFYVNKDEFNDIEFYTHKVFGENWQTYKTLTTGLNSNGYIYLRSNYHDDDWIFHENVTVKIGEGAGLYTEKVPSYHKNNRTDNNGDGVYENVTYEQGSHIIESIANADPSQKILVRFHGRQYYDDVTLGAKTKKAFEESYELSKAILELKSIN